MSHENDWTAELNKQQQLPQKRYQFTSHAAFLSFILQRRGEYESLVACLYLNEFILRLNPFSLQRIVLFGDMVKLPYERVRGRVYVEVAGGLESARASKNFQEFSEASRPIQIRRSRTFNERILSAIEIDKLEAAIMSSSSLMTVDAADANSDFSGFMNTTIESSLPCIELLYPSARRFDRAMNHIVNSRNFFGEDTQ